MRLEPLSGMRGAQVEPKAVLLYCYGAFELDVFVRLKPALAARNWSVVVVGHLPSIILRARRAGFAAVLLHPTRSRRAPTLPLDQTPEGILGQMTAQPAERFAHSAWEALNLAAETYSIRAVAAMNGLRLGGRIAKAFAKARGLPTLFIELGNVEPKLFVDPEGVNGAARLARHPEMLDAFSMSDAEIGAWRTGFLERRKAMNSIPQARARLNPWFMFDWIATRLRAIPQPLPLSIRERLSAKVRLLGRPVPADVRPDAPYVFLPLQVSYDVNLLLFSDHDNLSAIRVAAERARAIGARLVVKPHPAEQDARVLSAIRKVCEDEGHLITGYNTAELVLGCEEVVTINSTVGLEARLLGRPVTLLGRALYEKFSNRQAAVYAARYLLPFSPFGSDIADVGVADRIIAMIEAQERALEDGSGRLKPQ